MTMLAQGIWWRGGRSPSLFFACVNVNKVFNGLLRGVVDVILIAAGWEADNNRGNGNNGGGTDTIGVAATTAADINSTTNRLINNRVIGV